MPPPLVLVDVVLSKVVVDISQSSVISAR